MHPVKQVTLPRNSRAFFLFRAEISHDRQAKGTLSRDAQSQSEILVKPKRMSFIFAGQPGRSCLMPPSGPARSRRCRLSGLGFLVDPAEVRFGMLPDQSERILRAVAASGTNRKRRQRACNIAASWVETTLAIQGFARDIEGA